MILEILYKDDHVVAINKPHGLLVHRSPIAKNVSEFALQLLRDQLEQRVYPIHRLDRKTGGVLLFALDKETHKLIQQQFALNKITKTYIAIVRGYTDDDGIIDSPLKRDDGKVQTAITEYSTLQRSEIDLPFGKFKTSRYSLVKVNPQTGRMHQIRKHFAHILHPIIADRPHGCNKQNRLFKGTFNMTTMLLHAKKIEFNHPYENKMIKISALPGEEINRMIKSLNFNPYKTH